MSVIVITGSIFTTNKSYHPVKVRVVHLEPTAKLEYNITNKKPGTQELHVCVYFCNNLLLKVEKKLLFNSLGLLLYMY